MLKITHPQKLLALKQEQIQKEEYLDLETIIKTKKPKKLPNYYMIYFYFNKVLFYLFVSLKFS